MFNDPFVIEWIDDGQVAGEQRFAALGIVGDAVRLVSARRAVSFERRRYHDENQT